MVENQIQADTNRAQNPALLLDIGNTNTVLALTQPSGVYLTKHIPTSSVLADPTLACDCLSGLLSGVKAKTSAICSVVPRATTIWHAALVSLPCHATLVIDHTADFGLKLTYPNPSAIGIDRLVNAAAASELFKSAVITADFGTAVTIDVVNANKEFLGGVILPGLSLSFDFLAEKTALLPRLSPDSLKACQGGIPNNTRSAIATGTLLSWQGTLKEIFAHFKKNLSGPVVFCATGGCSDRLLEKIDLNIKVQKNLTLQGIEFVLRKTLLTHN